MTEAQILAEVLIALGQRTDCRVWRQHAGRFRALRDHNVVVRVAPDGIPDVCGILIDGRWLALEVKSKAGRQRKTQKAFQRMIEKHGGVYAVVRSAREAVSVVESNL